jgi:hypothetical protein
MSTALATSNRRRFTARRLALASIVMAAALGANASLTVAAATPYNTNLVKNAGAENGLNHWDTFPDGDFQTHKYGASGLGFPSKAAATAIGGSKYFFYAGPYDNAYGTCGDANQEWTLTGIGSAIDNGHVKVVLNGYAGTSGAADLNAHVDLYFRTSDNHPVASNGITKKVTTTNEAYRHIQKSKVLSKHTRTLRLHLWADGDATVSSGDCRAFWDNLSVVLKYV